MQENLLARYTVLHELGRGATGAVYAARDRTTGAAVALKRFSPGFSGKPPRIPRHRNIVEIYDAGEVAGTVYVAMEMLEGRSLRALLDEGPLPITRAIQIAHDIACGLAHAHLQGVVHGGLTASNIIVSPSGAAKITDFGTGQAARLSGPVDHRSDVFSLGALLYEMLAHQPPAEKPAPPSELNPHVPRALDAVVLSMLARQPADRMAGVPVLLREIERLEEGLGLASGVDAAIDEPAPGAAPQRPEPALRPIDHEAFARHRETMERESRQRSSGSRAGTFAALGLALAAAGIGFGSYLYYSSGPGERLVAASHAQEAPAAPGPTAPPPVAEAAREPVAAFGAWKEARAHVVDDTPSQEPLPAARAAVRTIAPPPAAKAITETAPAPQALPGTLFGLNPKPLAAPEKSPPMKKATAPEQQPAGTAQLVLAVSPGGELYVDGKPHGATPPTTTFDLEPGMHRIEVRSGSRRPYLTYMTVQAGDVRRIRHDFDAKPSRPPT